MIPVNFGVMLSLCLFLLGVAGFLLRKNAIVMFLSVELMLNSANLLFILYGKALGTEEGQILVLFIIALAAAEAAVGLALFILYFRRFKTLDLNRAMILRW